jgi:hypothetical protein
MQISPFRNQDERKADREEKREAVLRAAVRMFNAQGFHATSLDDVVEHPIAQGGMQWVGKAELVAPSPTPGRWASSPP